MTIYKSRLIINKKKGVNRMAKKRKPRVKYCDYGHETTGSVRRLPTSGDSGAYLCKRHWNQEMRWRKGKNETLKKAGLLTKSSRFPIRKFPGK